MKYFNLKNIVLFVFLIVGVLAIIGLKNYIVQTNHEIKFTPHAISPNECFSKFANKNVLALVNSQLRHSVWGGLTANQRADFGPTQNSLKGYFDTTFSETHVSAIERNGTVTCGTTVSTKMHGVALNSTLYGSGNIQFQITYAGKTNERLFFILPSQIDSIANNLADKS